jgi:hypothetical protein
VVPSRPAERLEAAPAARASGETEDRASYRARERNVVHQHHRRPAARWDPRLSPCRDRQLVETHLGLASRRRIRAN